MALETGKQKRKRPKGPVISQAKLLEREAASSPEKQVFLWPLLLWKSVQPKPAGLLDNFSVRLQLAPCAGLNSEASLSEQSEPRHVGTCTCLLVWATAISCVAVFEAQRALPDCAHGARRRTRVPAL